jgi:hypothetical protein
MARIIDLERAAEGGLIALALALVLAPFAMLWWLWVRLTQNDYD